MFFLSLSFVNIEGEQRQWKWNRCPDDFAALWWNRQQWNVVGFSQHLSKSIYFLLLSAFITDILDFFIIDRLEKANTDVKISPFSLPLTAARR